MLQLRHVAIILTTLIWLSGCSHPTGKPAVITQPPAPETITVDLATDLGPLEAHTAPLLRPTAATLTDSQLAVLQPILTDPIPTLVTLGESVKFDGKFPGETRDWTKWDQGVTALVQKNKAAGKPDVAVEYEIWNEPDRANSFKGSQADFFSVWIHTARLIVSIDPQAHLVGPSRSSFDAGWLQEFLKIGKEYNVPETTACWHENSLKPDIPGHVNTIGETFWQDGTGGQRIRILPSNSLDKHLRPSDAVLLLAGLQQAWRDSKFRKIDERLGIKLHHLATKDHAPRSIYYAYTAYADLVSRGGQVAKLSSSKNTDGMATWNAPQRTARVLIGRNVARSATTQPTPAGQAPPNQLGPLTLVLKNVSGTIAHVAVTTINDSGEQPFTPAPARESELPISTGELRLPLTEMTSGQAYSIELKITGTPATTQSTTQPTPPSTSAARNAS